MYLIAQFCFIVTGTFDFVQL